MDFGVSFIEDVFRFLVFGEEGELVFIDFRFVSYSFCFGKGFGIKGEILIVISRRSDLDLGYEFEGSVFFIFSYLKWVELLYFLLDD